MNQPVPKEIDALHGAIMNIQGRRSMSTFCTADDRKLYAEGHRDARHDAADMVCAHAAEWEDSTKKAEASYPLRVWWIPQIGVNAEPFHVPVADDEQAKLILTTLADYDAYQFKFNIKGDYSNVGGLEVCEDGEWCEWYSADGDDIGSLMKLDAEVAEEAAQ